MSTASTIADYIRHKRSLGIRFDHGATVLSTFSRSVGANGSAASAPASVAVMRSSSELGGGVRIEPHAPGCDMRTFECPACEQSESAVVHFV